jgi:GGDEF domain-containing protein
MVDNYRTGGARADTLRKRFAEVLLKAARPGDMIGRTGVDDFTLLFPQTEPKLVQVAFQRVNKSTEAWNLRGGLTQFPEHGDSPTNLIERARALCQKARSKDYEHGLRILTPAITRVKV